MLPQEAQDLIHFVLYSHFPILLAPFLTWSVGGLVVAVRATSGKVVAKALLLSFVGGVGLAAECVILCWASPLPPPILWILAAKRTIAEVNGDNLICAVLMELMSINVLISFTRTEQNWIAFLKWMVVILCISLLGITVPVLFRSLMRGL